MLKLVLNNHINVVSIGGMNIYSLGGVRTILFGRLHSRFVPGGYDVE